MGSFAHYIAPHFDALGEFSAASGGHTDACGPVAEAVVFSWYWQQERPDPAKVDAIRTRLIHENRFVSGKGMTVDNLAHDLQTAYSLPAQLYPWGTSVDVLYKNFHDGILAGNLVVMNFHAAGNLHLNQPGVANHFTVFGGIDTDLGYLNANGDRVDENGHVYTSVYVPLYWVGWDSILRAQPSAMVVIKKHS